MQLPGDRRAWLRVGLLVVGMLLLPGLVWVLFPIRRTAASPVGSFRQGTAQAAAPPRELPRAPAPRLTANPNAQVREVRGVVLDATGHAVDKATVTCLDRDDLVATTDLKGAFKLPGAAIGCTAVASHDAHGKTPTSTLSGVGPNRLEFIPSATITGEVVDDGGRVVSSYTLAIDSFVPAEGMQSQRPSSQRRTIDDPRGAFQWGGLPPGTYTLVATAAGHPPGKSDSIELELGKTATTKIVLPQGGKLTGRVTDAATGKALAGVSVEAGGNTASTGPDGAYVLDGIRVVGALSVSFFLEGYRRKLVTVSPSQAVTQDATLTTGDGFEYGGIGAVLKLPPGAPFAQGVPSKGGPFVVGGLMPDAPAAAAGVHINDEITEIDGQATSTLTLADVLDRLRGPEGSVVRIRVSREGQALDIEVTRKVMVR